MSALDELLDPKNEYMVGVPGLDEAAVELAALRARLAEAERLLEESEWIAARDDACWSCRVPIRLKKKDDGTYKHEMNHYSGCELAALLRGHKSGKESDNAV